MLHVWVSSRPKPPYYLITALLLSLPNAALAVGACDKIEKSLRCEDSLTVQASSQPQSTYGSLEVVTQSASRLGLTNLETPRSIDVISAQAIQQRGDKSLAAVVERAPGMSGVASPRSAITFHFAVSDRCPGCITASKRRAAPFS